MLTLQKKAGMTAVTKGMSMIHDEARAVRSDSEQFVAFVTYFDDCAIVQVYVRPSKFEIDFSREVAYFETARRGAVSSARREIKRLENS